MLRTCRPIATPNFTKIRTSRALLYDKRRSIWTEIFYPVTEGFLDLSQALPWPPSLPPYASTIILTSVLSRLIFTLPFSIWAKKRQWRLENEVLPILKVNRIPTAQRIAREMKAEGLASLGLEKFKKIHMERLKQELGSRQKVLCKEHACTPWPTILVPAVTQLPLFVFGTASLSALTSRPSPLNDESFLTLTSLAHPDPTGVLPVILGLVTLANVETANWFIGSERALRNAQLEEQRRKADDALIKEGKVVRVRAKDAVQGSLRILSVARILLGTMVDGSILLFWLSSASFGLVQSWAFNWWDARRAIQVSRSSSTRAPSKSSGKTI